MLAELTHEQWAAGLDQVARDLLDEAAIAGPPVDAVALARALGMTVAMDDRQQGRARFVRLGTRRRSGPRPTILLHDDPRPERRQWAVAHEVGEYAAHRLFDTLGIDPRETPTDAREEAANRLAGRLLLPDVWFQRDAGACGWDLLQLKARYATASHELIARRMLECTPPVVISIFDNGRLSFRRGNLPGRVPPPLPSEWSCWRAVHRGNRPRQTREGPHRVQGWPIHEEQWKREILRMEIDQFAIES